MALSKLKTQVLSCDLDVSMCVWSHYHSALLPTIPTRPACCVMAVAPPAPHITRRPLAIEWAGTNGTMRANSPPVQPLTFSLPDSGDLYGALVLSTLFLLVFFAAEVAWRAFRVPTELTRKLVHAGGGVVVLLVPQLLSSLWVALGLAVAFVVILVVARRLEALPSVHAIERRSVGAYLFPVAVCVCVLSSRGELVRFEVPLLALAFGDAAAALVGRSIGSLRYRVWGARRSIEGSLAFALTTAVIATGFFSLAGISFVVALTLALVIGLLLSVVEAVSVYGWDNLTIPAVGLVLTDLALRIATLPDPLRSQVLFLAVVVVLGLVAGLAAVVLVPTARRAALLRTQPSRS